MLYNDVFVFIKGISIFLVGPIEAALWLEDYRTYVSKIDSKLIEAFFIHSFLSETTQPITSIVHTITAIIKNDEKQLGFVMEGFYSLFDGIKYTFDFE